MLFDRSDLRHVITELKPSIWLGAFNDAAVTAHLYVLVDGSRADAAYFIVVVN